MTMSETTYEHIVLDEAGVPWIEHTTVKVIELIVERQAYGDTPEQLQSQHPHLTLGQIYSALAYYEDHRASLDADIERRLALVDQLQTRAARIPILDALNG